MRPMWKKEEEDDAKKLAQLIEYNKGEKVSLPPNTSRPTTLVERQDQYTKIEKNLLKLQIYDLETRDKYKVLDRYLEKNERCKSV